MRSRATMASMRTWKAVLATSFVWFTVVLLLLYTGKPCSELSDGHQEEHEATDALTHQSTSPNSSLQIRFIPHRNRPPKKVVTKRVSTTISTKPVPPGPTIYPAEQLHEWVLPPVVPETLGGAGEMGRSVKFGDEVHELMKKKFKLHEFNVMASDVISLNRSLPDFRVPGCKTKAYPARLPDTSVVIVFHNEALSTLLRTVHSVINRSPQSLLKEIVLVDDASNYKHLGKELEMEVANLPVFVRILRTGKRSGLIRARLLGAQHAKGAVLTFLDAHCECAEGWLEPLLAEIAKNRTTVVSPVIEVISDKTFEVIPTSDATWGGFSWKLAFRWFEVPEREKQRRAGDRTEPLRSPTMAGGLFSMDRNYFYELGSYDVNMDVWGAENIEMSFRIWQCGGTLLIVTCSHVGHVFRDTSPYTFPGGGAGRIVLHNTVRVAHVWLDDFKRFYFEMVPEGKTMDAGDLSARVSLRKRLGCKSFQWYLETIFPESPMLIGYHHFGEIQTKDKSCLDTMARNSGGLMGIGPCHGLGGNQIFVYTKKQNVVSDDLCMDATGSGPGPGQVKLINCHGKGGNQIWIYNQDAGTIKHDVSGKCLSKPTKGDLYSPVLLECDNSILQQWIMRSKVI